MLHKIRALQIAFKAYNLYNDCAGIMTMQDNRQYKPLTGAPSMISYLATVSFSLYIFGAM